MTPASLRTLMVATVAALAAAGVLPLSPLAAGHPARHQLAALHRSCPTGDRRPLTSTTPGAARELVPRTPRQVLLCRYGGANAGSESFRLVAQRLVVRRSIVDRLAREFDALTQLHGVVACPADVGRNIIAIFRYRVVGKADDPVTVDVTGCTPVSDGHLIRSALLAPGPKLVSRLEALTSRR